jgi:hypothetical protein
VREIEVKYHVDDLEALLAALKGRGIELSDPIYQDDQAYAPHLVPDDVPAEAIQAELAAFAASFGVHGRTHQ